MKTCILLIGLFLIASCQKEAVVPVPYRDPVNSAYLNLPVDPYRYNLPVKDEVVTLGRVLFYDKRLSGDMTVSCASCHKQELGFSDNVGLSQGIHGQSTVRNSLSIQNIPTNNSSLFWDGREINLERMVLLPIANQVEMGMDVNLLPSRLNTYQEYRKLFKDAFGNATPNTTALANALAWFVRSLKTDNDRFDLYIKSGSNNNSTPYPLTQQELTGYKLFVSDYNCNVCHKIEDKFATSGMMTSGNVGAYGGGGFGVLGSFANVGLDVKTTDPGNRGRFKIPSLRNVTLTAPYMHDGSLKTLGEVIDHYSTGILANPNLAIDLQEPDGIPKKFNITDADRDALIAFLGTLTDNTMINDPRFSDPFKNN